MSKRKMIIRVAGNCKATRNIFPITCKGRKTSKFLTHEKYKWVNDVITDKCFPIKKHPPQKRLIELIKFNRNMTLGEIFAKFKSRGLERPTYEDALVFGDTYPKRGMKHPIVFLHKPIVKCGFLFVLVLNKYGCGRGLDIGCLDDDWSQNCAFAAIRR